MKYFMQYDIKRLSWSAPIFNDGKVDSKDGAIADGGIFRSDCDVRMFGVGKVAIRVTCEKKGRFRLAIYILGDEPTYVLGSGAPPPPPASSPPQKKFLVLPGVRTTV
jgi:hypothetical protein